MKPFEDLKWKEIESNKVKVFQLGDEPVYTFWGICGE